MIIQSFINWKQEAWLDILNPILRLQKWRVPKPVSPILSSSLLWIQWGYMGLSTFFLNPQTPFALNIWLDTTLLFNENKKKKNFFSCELRLKTTGLGGNPNGHHKVVWRKYKPNRLNLMSIISFQLYFLMLSKAAELTNLCASSSSPGMLMSVICSKSFKGVGNTVSPLLWKNLWPKINEIQNNRFVWK